MDYYCIFLIISINLFIIIILLGILGTESFKLNIFFSNYCLNKTIPSVE